MAGTTPFICKEDTLNPNSHSRSSNFGKRSAKTVQKLQRQLFPRLEDIGRSCRCRCCCCRQRRLRPGKKSTTLGSTYSNTSGDHRQISLVATGNNVAFALARDFALALAWRPETQTQVEPLGTSHLLHPFEIKRPVHEKDTHGFPSFQKHIALTMSLQAL